MLVPHRTFSSPEYRYGFQGQEKDDEVKGNGNSLNYKFRMHDPRVGRFFAVDPLAVAYSWNSPYSFSENDVVRAVELEGGEKKIVIHKINGFYDDDGSPIIVSTSVKIEKLTWVTFDNLKGRMYASTEVFYAHKNGKIYKGQEIYEEIRSGNPTPSANYDYTSLEIGSNSQKDKTDNDKKYAGWNPLKWGKLVKRDFNAPDNQIARDLTELSPLLEAGFGLGAMNLYAKIASKSKNLGMKVKAVELYALKKSLRVPFKVTKKDAISIGKSFVGKNPTKIYRNGKLHAMQSKDGTRLFRFPVKKLKNGKPTGKYDANFQIRKKVNVSWKNGQAVKRGDISNTHLGIKE